jgi:hypothetical protein
MTAATPSQITFGDIMQALDMVSEQLKMLQLTSRQGSSQMMLGLEKSQAVNHIASLTPDAVPNSSQMEIVMPV